MKSGEKKGFTQNFRSVIEETVVEFNDIDFDGFNLSKWAHVQRALG